MKVNVLASIVSISAIAVLSCMPKPNKSPDLVLTDETQYKVYEVNTQYEDFEILSDKQNYFRVPSDIKQTPLLQKLEDGFNAYTIFNDIQSDMEIQYRFDLDIKDNLDRIDASIFHEPAVKQATEVLKNNVIALLNEDRSVLFDSIWFDKYNHELDTYHDIMGSYYRTKYFGELSQEAFDSIYDKTKFVADYYEIYAYRKDVNFSRGKATDILMERLKDETINFDQKCIYLIEYAHSEPSEELEDYVHPCIKMMEDAMNEGKYSIYLQELWLTWRCLEQFLGYGSSRDSDIPNRMYNDWRMKCLQTIYQHIANYPDDIMAINQFFKISSNENILRYGDYDFGNQNVLWELALGFIHLNEE